MGDLVHSWKAAACRLARGSLLLGAALLTVGSLPSQLCAQEVKIGSHRVLPEPNVPRVRGQNITPWHTLKHGDAFAGKRNVLVQFASEDNGKARRAVDEMGIELGAYLGANAYYARMPESLSSADLQGTGLKAVMPMRPEWKVQEGLLEGKIPSYALREQGRQAVLLLSYPKGIEGATVRSWLLSHGYTGFKLFAMIRTVQLEVPVGAIATLANAGWCTRVSAIPPPDRLFNYWGARAGGAARLARPVAEGGRELSGKGVNLGVWDLSIGAHVDLYGRFQKEEAILPEQIGGVAHGTHVLGSILGGGLLDPMAKGMAPEAKAYTYNFGNTPEVVLQMEKAHKDYKVSLTSNSYGGQLTPSTCWMRLLNTYSASGAQYQDLIAESYPLMTHVFAAGNSRGICSDYASSLALGKNLIYVGAVDRSLRMSTFSSWGPTMDGKLLPTVVADGVKVRSTVLSSRYEAMDGTSMATPIVTGHLALLTQRFQDLHNGDLPMNTLLRGIIANTATDLGRKGPDYVYGFGAVNAIAAVRAVEKGWFDYGMLQPWDKPQVHRVQVPKGVSAVRVMLVWNDPYSDKQWAVGENNLLNDLDLIVRVDGQELKSWTLNPAKPSDPATLEGDHRNTMEQVLVEGVPAGELEIVVTGAKQIKQGKEQYYTLTWFFEEKPEVLAPVAGDIYSPGDTVVLRTAGMPIALAEMSFDGGKTYTVKGKADVRGISVLIPKDTKPTAEAIIRLSDKAGHSVKSGLFTVMGRPLNFRVDAGDCGSAVARLTWLPVEGAEGYEVLEYDYGKKEWKVLTTVNTPSYDLLTSAATAQNQRMLSVRATKGSIRSMRAVGALLAPRASLAPLASSLPYEDYFIQEGAPYMSVLGGDKPSYFFSGTAEEFGKPKQARTLVLYAADEAADWASPFENKQNVNTLRICNLDLSQMKAGEKLAFSTIERMLLEEYSAEDFVIRLLVNGQEHPDVAGNKHHNPSAIAHNAVWDLSSFVGQKVKLEWQLATRNPMQFVQILGYKLFKPADKADVAIALSEIAPANEMREQMTTVKILNRSMRSLTFPLKVWVDDQEQPDAGMASLTLAPYQFKEVEISPNFEAAAEAQQGKKMALKVTADVADDAKPQDNTQILDVYNYGMTMRQPAAILDVEPDMDSPGEIEVSEDPCYWTDMGGTFFPYGPRQGSLMMIAANSAQTVIEMEEWDLAEGDTLFVYTISEQEGNNIDGWADIDSKPVAYTFTGKGANQTIRLYGTAVGYFKSVNREHGAGWRAKCYAQELNGEALSLKSLAIDKSFPNDKTTLSITVANSEADPIEGAKLHVLLGDRHNVKRLVKDVPSVPGSSEVTVAIPDKAAPVPSVIPVRVELVSPAIAEPYVLSTTIVHDDYFLGGTSSTAPEDCPFISKAYAMGAPEDKQWEFEQENYLAGGISRHLEKKIDLYGNGRNVLEVEVGYADNYVVAIYIDAKAPVGFATEAPELYIVKDNGLPSVYPTIDWTGQNLPAGECRMRIVVTETEADQQAYREGKEVKFACALDLTANIIEGKNPRIGDYSLSEMHLTDDMGNEVHSGINLPSAAKLSVLLHNNGIEKRTDPITISVYDGDKLLFTHPAKHSDGIAPDSYILVTDFPKTVDLSALAEHRIRLVIPEDANADNNEIASTYYCLPQPTEKPELYCLSMEGNLKEYVDLGDVLSTAKNGPTIEGWFCFDKIQSCPLIESIGVRGDADMLFGMLGKPTEGIPWGSFVLTEGDGVFWTDGPVVKAKEWTHIAIVFRDDYVPLLYVNGKRVALKSKGVARLVDFKQLHIAAGFKGKLTGLRIWDAERSETEIAENMPKRLAESSAPPQLLGEYLMQDDATSIGISPTWGEGHTGILRGERKPSAEPVRQPVKGLLRNTDFEGQVLPLAYSAAGQGTVTLRKGVDLSQVKGAFLYAWQGTTATIAASPVTPAQVYNFSAGAVSVDLHLDVFGKTVTDRVAISAKEDASNACELLSATVAAAKNPGLRADENLAPVRQAQELKLEGMESLNAVKLQVVKLSEGAVVQYGGKEFAEGEVLTLDLNAPALVKVFAANKRDFKVYEFTVPQLEQQIDWANTSISVVYGDELTGLNAKASSGLKVEYVSGHPGVLTWISGKLVATWCLETSLIASQDGNARWKEAMPVSRKVIVTPPMLTVRALDCSMAVGAPMPELSYRVEGLKLDDKESILGPISLTVFTEEGTSWNPSMPPLPEGEYVIMANPMFPEQPNYQVRLVEGTLTVGKAKSPKPNSVAQSEGLAISPNPALSSLRLRGLEAKTPVEVYTLSGALVLRAEVQPNGALDVRKLSAGMYLLRARNQVLPFVKQ